MRNYSTTNGTIDLYTVYGASVEKNKTLRDLGFTYLTAKDNWPCFAGYWEARGWDTNDFLSLYFIEASWNDALWSTDTLMGLWGYYRPGFVTQSRAWIKAPDGWFKLNFGLQTGLGRYSGKHAQVWSEGGATSTPGTALEPNHATWLTKYQQERICMNATAWGKDYGVIGGLAYTEGIIVENFRFVGGMSGKPKDALFFGTGITLNEPGENSVIRECMSCDHNNTGYTVFNGTPFHIDTCSAFTNKDAGFDLLGSNGLCNLTIEVPSGDDNPALIRIRPRDTQSVGGGTINISGLKSESRTVLQRPIVIEGSIGDLNMTINGMTANFDGPDCPELIRMEKGSQWQIDARGVDLRSKTQSLFYHATTGSRLTGGKPYSGNSFVVNDEGLKFASRSNMAYNTVALPQPKIDSFTATPSTTTGGSVTLAWQTTDATGVSISGVSGTLSVDGSTVVQVSTTTTFTLTATNASGSVSSALTVTVGSNSQIPTTGWQVTASTTNGGGRELPTYAIDGNPDKVWSNGQAQSVADALIQFDALTEQTFISATFVVQGVWVNDYARTPQVYVGASSSGGIQTAATITGTSTMTVTFATPVKGRYFRLTAKKTNGVSNWFTVGEAKFFKP